MSRIVSFPTSHARRKLRIASALMLLVASASAFALDWNSIKPAEFGLMFPGQQSWEKALTASKHKGANKIRAGEKCTACHAGEEADQAADTAEDTGFKGRNTLGIQVRTALENGVLHVQIAGPLGGLPAPGVAMMIGSDALKSATQAGCWAACHDDAPGMASDSGQDLGKYLAQSRTKSTATGGGTNIKPQADLQAALASGQFLDLIEVKATGESERGYVLDKLHEKDAPGAAAIRTEGDRWVAELQRPLAAAGPGELALEPGHTYYFGVAVHDADVKKYQHLVSLGQQLVIGSGTAEVVVGKQTEEEEAE